MLVPLEEAASPAPGHSSEGVRMRRDGRSPCLWFDALLSPAPFLSASCGAHATEKAPYMLGVCGGAGHRGEGGELSMNSECLQQTKSLFPCRILKCLWLEISHTPVIYVHHAKPTQSPAFLVPHTPLSSAETFHWRDKGDPDPSQTEVTEQSGIATARPRAG